MANVHGEFLVGAVEEHPVRTLRAGQCRCLNTNSRIFMMELLDSPSQLKKYVFFSFILNSRESVESETEVPQCRQKCEPWERALMAEIT